MALAALLAAALLAALLLAALATRRLLILLTGLLLAALLLTALMLAARLAARILIGVVHGEILLCRGMIPHSRQVERRRVCSECETVPNLSASGHGSQCRQKPMFLI